MRDYEVDPDRIPDALNDLMARGACRASELSTLVYCGRLSRWPWPISARATGVGRVTPEASQPQPEPEDRSCRTRSTGTTETVAATHGSCDQGRLTACSMILRMASGRVGRSVCPRRHSSSRARSSGCRRVPTSSPVCFGRLRCVFVLSPIDPLIDQCYRSGEPRGSANFPPALTTAAWLRGDLWLKSRLPPPAVPS
jgi:hypothetical protein